MNRVIGARASTILYNTLMSNREQFGNGSFLMPANVCPIVPITFLKAGVPFEFLDINPDTQCIDEGELTSRIYAEDSSVCGVIYVHSYGFQQNIEHLFNKLKVDFPELFLIDDRCICIPDTSGSTVLTDSDLTLFSTGYAKIVEFGKGGFGYLGLNCKYAEHLKPFVESDHDELVSYMNESIVSGNKMLYKDTDWLEFSHELNENEYMLRIESHIAKALEHKNQLNEIYSTKIDSSIQMGGEFNLWRFNLQVEDKQLMLDKIFKSDLFASSHYSSVSYIFSDKQAPIADNSHRKMVNLFNDHRFSAEMAIKTCEIINSILN